MNQMKQSKSSCIPVSGRLRNANGKTVAAVVLVSVMLLLWGRVLLKGRGGPAEAAGSEMNPAESLAVPAVRPVTVVPVELAFEAGRHDVLTSDMFSTDQWEALHAVAEDKPVVVVKEDTREKQLLRKLENIAAMLKLEAIIHAADGTPLQVFVNDAILTVGSVLTVREGPEQYELVLTAIGENEALFDWNGASITLKMTETVEK